MTFLRLYDNSKHVKVNFISDDELAAEMNSHDPDKMYPAIASPALMGGYIYPILKEIAGDRTFQILKAPLPKTDENRSKELDQLQRQAETLYAYVDSGEMTIVQIEGLERAATPLSSMGWTILNGAKTFKRLKTLNRPFRLWSMSDQPLRVAIVNDDDYCDEDLEGYTEEEIERLLDGAIVIHPRLFEDCLANVEFPIYVPGDDDRPELAVDFYRSQEYLRQAHDYQAFNARIFGPMIFKGIDEDDPLWERPGMLKGEAHKDIAGTCERMHVDVICARSALKFEVANDVRRIVLLEPQKAKLSQVSSDLQTMINVPALYQPDDVAKFTKIFLMDTLERLKRDEIMQSWYDMSSPYFNASQRVWNQNDVLTLTKWNARAWQMSGMRISQSPWLFEQLGSAIIKTLRVQDQQKLRFPVPCAARAQVISASYASMAGADLEIARGSARWCEELESLVVNDLDWLEMYRSHGGHDLDDFFVIYWRTIGNLRKLVVVRSPNDWGEYSIFDYVEGDWYPQMETVDGQFIIFPQVSDDPELWGERLSEAYRAGKVIYTGLPSENDKVKEDPHPYGPDDVLRLMSNNQASGSCVGANVNARSLRALAMRNHRQVQLATMESCIDTGTQGGSQDDIQAVHAEARSIVEDLINDPEVKIDSYMWFTRFANIFKQPFPSSRLTSDTHISKAHQYRLDVSRSFMRIVREYAQTHLTANIDPRIHALGRKHLRYGYDTIVETRKQMYQMQNVGEQSLEPGNWREVHSLMLERLNAQPTDVDKFDFVLAMYSASFKAKTTSSNRVTDQLVMNPHIFPYLLSALRFYGIAYHIVVDDKGNLTRHKTDSWSLTCKECGTIRETDDPVMLQSYHTHEGICKECRTPAAETA